MRTERQRPHMTPQLPALVLTIELSTNLYESYTRERCPRIRFTQLTTTGERDLSAMRTDVEKPRLELSDGTISEILAQDTLSRVIDEPAWLAELARVLAPGGTIRLSLPASGPLAWLDARNIYRYITDIVGRGDTPNDPLPTGWNRHYSLDDAREMLCDAGFTDIDITCVGIGAAEPIQLAGLIAGNFLFGKRDTELRLHPLRTAMERVDRNIRVPAVGTMLAITAARARVEPDDPADDDAAHNHPAAEIDHE